MDCPTDLVLLNTLFLFRFFYHAIGINSISLSDALCQRLQIYCIAVRFENISSNGNALNGNDTQASPHRNWISIVASLLHHHSSAGKCPIAD